YPDERQYRNRTACGNVCSARCRRKCLHTLNVAAPSQLSEVFNHHNIAVLVVLLYVQNPAAIRRYGESLRTESGFRERADPAHTMRVKTEEFNCHTTRHLRIYETNALAG